MASMLASCEINDSIDSVVRVGQVAPHVFWELPTSSVNAGSTVPFYSQYYTVGDKKIDRLEVWYDVNENIQKLVSCPLVTSFKYSVSLSSSSLSRESQQIETYTHSEINWVPARKAYVIDSAFHTSRTLRTVEWKEVKVFDDTKFAAYFPASFATQFKDSMYKLMKISDFRKIMVTLNLMTTARFLACTDSTFNTNSGLWDSFIKTDSIPSIKAKYDAILFKDLIYDSSAQIYKIEYSKSYKLKACFKAYDKDQVVGITEKKEIDLR